MRGGPINWHAVGTFAAGVVVLIIAGLLAKTGLQGMALDRAQLAVVAAGAALLGISSKQPGAGRHQVCARCGSSSAGGTPGHPSVTPDAGASPAHSLPKA